MKRAKKLYVLLGVLIGICALTIGISTYEEKKEEIKNSNMIILQISEEDVTHISWEYENESLSFSRDESWIYDGDEKFPVYEDRISELLEPFETLTAAFIIENVTDLGQYGLEDPEAKITIKTEEESYEILMGDFSTMDSQRYVSIGDENVYLVTEDPMDTYQKELDDFFLHDDVPSFADIREIVISGNENRTIYYEEDSEYSYDKEDEYFTTVNGKTLPVDPEKVDEYTNGITNLKLEDYKTYTAASEVADYGLDDPDLTISISYISDEKDETFALSLAKNPKADEDAENYAAYARIDDSDIIYEITKEDYESLMAVSYNDLRHEEIFTASFSEITELEILLENETYLITKEETDDEISYRYGEEEIEYAGLSSAVAGLLAEEFTAEEPEQKLEISLTLSLDNENFPQVQLEFYRYDGEQCLAVVDGEPIALVGRGAVVELIEAVNAIVLK